MYILKNSFVFYGLTITDITKFTKIKILQYVGQFFLKCKIGQFF